MKTRINIEEVWALRQRLAEINAIPFADIEWLRNGVPLEFTAEEIEEQRFIGLSNASFIEFTERFPLEAT